MKRYTIAEHSPFFRMLCDPETGSAIATVDVTPKSRLRGAPLDAESDHRLYQLSMAPEMEEFIRQLQWHLYASGGELTRETINALAMGANSILEHIPTREK